MIPALVAGAARVLPALEAVGHAATIASVASSVMPKPKPPPAPAPVAGPGTATDFRTDKAAVFAKLASIGSMAGSAFRGLSAAGAVLAPVATAVQVGAVANDLIGSSVESDAKKKRDAADTAAQASAPAKMAAKLAALVHLPTLTSVTDRARGFVGGAQDAAYRSVSAEFTPTPLMAPGTANHAQP